jgi:uncharacterized membrane protein
MNLKVKAGLKTLTVFGIAAALPLAVMHIIVHVPPMIIALSLVSVAVVIMSNTVYNYFLTLGEVQEKVNALIDKLEK